MIGFLCPFQPRSINARRKEKYKENIKQCLKHYYPDIPKFNNEKLYGIVYYFYKSKTGSDADNLSKPIWDALKTVLYNDDKIIKLRYSGVYDLNNDVNKLDITKMPSNVYMDFMEYIENIQSEHLLYIELGKLNDSLYIIGGETYEAL
jgi:Holliday junction resolvase RusA-like endonuclease